MYTALLVMILSRSLVEVCISFRQRLFDHHVHLPVSIATPDGDLDFGSLHLSTGWVTVEEVIRFLIVEVGVSPKADNWNDELLASEEKFKEWTSRTV